KSGCPESLPRQPPMLSMFLQITELPRFILRKRLIWHEEPHIDVLREKQQQHKQQPDSKPPDGIIHAVTKKKCTPRR
ncbi:MAG: hypothetical protein MRZ51_03900, partial [Faecalibacterium sp.]|nr:hypothetical protein [Faecalibacterium sp.]